MTNGHEIKNAPAPLQCAAAVKIFAGQQLALELFAGRKGELRKALRGHRSAQRKIHDLLLATWPGKAVAS